MNVRLKLTTEELKVCRKAYYEANKDKIKEYMKAYQKAYYKTNKDKLKERSKAYYKTKPKPFKEPKVKKTPNEIKEQRKEYRKQYLAANKEKVAAKKKAYFEANKDKMRKHINDWQKNEREINPLFKLKSNLRTLIGNSIRNGGFKKLSRTEQILGCTFEQFKLHFESQFEPWMTWENRGLYNGELNYGWDIDHIIPLDSAEDEIGLLQLNHYTNLQPLCSHINRDVKRHIH